MAREVIKEDKGPKEIKCGKEGKESVWICMCGLSKNQPLCDGSHKLIQDEDDSKLYRYTNGKRTEVK